MDRAEKIAYARRYCRELVARHPGIAGIVLGGSLARGNDLPISDVDLWCFVDESAHPLPVGKHSAGDLYIDIDQHPSDLLVRADIGEDPYICGYLHDAVILHDRDGQVHRCQERARACLGSPSYRKAQLCSIRANVERNYGEFAASLRARDACETCRSSIFAAWSLCDHMLTAKGVSPGGARGLARLADVWPEAASAIVGFEGSADVECAQIDCLLDTYRSVADTSPFFEMWFDKVEWMFAHAHRPDALHALWIALGLRIKDVRARTADCGCDRLAGAAERWLDTVGWDLSTKRQKLHQLGDLIDRFCGQGAERQRT